MTELALGTSQFGSLYGIKNQGVRVPEEEVNGIVQKALDLNIKTIDTAVSYGDAELRLGKLDLSNFKINSKISRPSSDAKFLDQWVFNEIKKSLERLNIECLDTIFVHDAKWILNNDSAAFINGLVEAKNTNLVKKIGISIYETGDIPNLYKLHNFEVIQAPLNLIDRRFEESGWLSRLKENGIEIQVRSIFLQGLLLMKASDLPDKFYKWKFIWEEFEKILTKTKTNAIEACLSYPMSIKNIDKIVLGVDNANQLLMINKHMRTNSLVDQYSFMSNEDIKLINPSLWSSL